MNKGYCENCQCDSCQKVSDIRKEFEKLKQMMEEFNKANGLNDIPHVEPVPMPVYPFPYPYIPGTPIGPYWTWPITISGGTVSNGDLDNINTFPNWVNGDGGSTI